MAIFILLCIQEQSAHIAQSYTNTLIAGKILNECFKNGLHMFLDFFI